MSAAFASAAGVTLLVGSTPHRGWRAMKVNFAIDAAAARVALEMSDRWSADLKGVPDQMVPGSGFRLALDGEEVMAGHLDTVALRYDAREKVLDVTGRDAVGDLVDCAASPEGPFEWANIGLEEAARRLAAPFGIPVRREADCGRPVPRLAINPGATVWETLEELGRQRGVLITGDGRGTLLLTRGGAGGKVQGPVVMGENVLTCRASFDWHGRFSETIVRGQDGAAAPVFDGVQQQLPGQTTWTNEAAATAAIQRRSPTGRARDAKVQRYRPRLILAERAGDSGNFIERAEWEVRVAAGRSVKLIYTVPGWRAAGGALWRPNTLVDVKDALLGLNREMLVSEVVFALSRQDGSVTELTLVPPDAYDLRATAPRVGRADRASPMTSGGVEVSIDGGRSWSPEAPRPPSR